MAVRGLGGPGLRRAARSRAGVAGLAAALYLGAGLLATSPAVFETDRFLGYGVAREGRVTPGDHQQTTWQLWLPGHQLARGAAPWLDPYSFQPEVEPRVNFAGWPFALVFGPLEALLGTVAGWNAFVLLTYVGAGGCAALWLRALGLGLGPALVGGLAFALAPYRVAQSAGHLLGPISLLLPLALYGIERRRAWLAVAALVSIPLSGQVHLALGAIPFALAYALVRRRPREGIAAADAAVAGGFVVWALSLRDTVERPFAEVERYSASLGDFVSRDPGEFERFVYLGWLLPLAAVAGLGALCFRNTISRPRPLAAALGLGALVPCLLALGANLPGYETLWRQVPGLDATRVPERFMPIACLALGGLVAFAVDAGRTALLPRHRKAVLPVAVTGVAVLLAIDLRVPVFGAVAAETPNAAYAAIRGEGRLLELPVFRPDVHYGSVYLAYARQSPRERPQGYSTIAPKRAVGLARELRPLSCGRGTVPADLGIRFVAVHRGLYAQSGFFADGCPERAEAMLRASGWRLLARDGKIATYAR